MVFIGKILLIRYTINQCSIVCVGKFYGSGTLLTSVLLCVVPFNATFIAPLVTAVTYVYVCNKMGKVGESVYINKTIEIDIYV